VSAPADPAFLTQLNAGQRAAAQHGDGPLLVIAGAGTGKTKTLAARVAALIRGGAPARRILLLTFTRRAATEMLRRAGQVVGEATAAAVWGGTFHAVAHRLLRLHGPALGLDRAFTVLDQGDAEDLLHLIRTDFELHRSARRFPQKSTLLSIYSRCVNAAEPLEQALATRFPWCRTDAGEIRRVFEEYAARKTARGLLDYDDLLLYWDQALQHDGVARAVAGGFDHVLVDEYQDTNPLQADILERLWTGMTRTGHAGRSIMVVGDDAQSIYSFRGATIENILGFPARFRGATTVTLEQNYRSVTPILAASNAVIAQARRRFTKNLWSRRESEVKPHLVTCPGEIEQSLYVAERILEYREQGVPLIRQAVLFRASHNSDALEIELQRRNVPFVKWGGLKFLEAAHIKDLLAFLRVLENPRDDLSWMRVLQMIDGIGPGRARQAFEHVQAAPQRLAALTSWSAPPAARKRVGELAAVLVDLAAADTPLAVQIERIRRYYTPIFTERYEQPESRLRDLDQLELLAQRSSSRAEFLAELTLDPPQSTGDLAGPPLLDEEYTTLSTIHSAKGCEWDVVYLLHAADGVLPSDMASGEAEVEEELRLLYVAMTRARNDLHVVFPLRYYHRKHALGDAYSTAQLSRFLPPEVHHLFERRTPPAAGGPDDPPPPAAEAPVGEAVRARLQRLWG